MRSWGTWSTLEKWWVLWMYYIPNSKICLKHVWLQYNIKSLWLFSFIFAQNSISGLILHNGLNSIKILQLFGFIWVKICSHLYPFPLPNYLFQTPQNYSVFMWSSLFSKSKLLFSVSLLKLTWRSVLITPFVILLFKAGDYFVIASLIINWSWH